MRVNGASAFSVSDIASVELHAADGTPLLELERWVLDHSDRLHAISEAIRVDVELTSGVRLDDERVVVAPIGSVDRFVDAPPRSEDATADTVTILFVGRFEKRKGVDLLLGALPDVLTAVPSARVVMVGRNDLAGESGRPYAEEFLEAHADRAWIDRVDIRGEVDDHAPVVETPQYPRASPEDVDLPMGKIAGADALALSRAGQ